MSKMSDMAATIEELRTAAAAINDAANWLAEMFGGAGDAEPAAPSEPALTLEQVRAVLADKSRQGHTAEIRSLLQKYGAAKLIKIIPKQKPRKFCSDTCRTAWWNSHPDCVDRKAVYAYTCAHCGKPFTAYGNKERKYCSHGCYIADRFGEECGCCD